MVPALWRGADPSRRIAASRIGSTGVPVARPKEHRVAEQPVGGRRIAGTNVPVRHGRAPMCE
jgi:hypothetical protein